MEITEKQYRSARMRMIKDEKTHGDVEYALTSEDDTCRTCMPEEADKAAPCRETPP